MLLRVALLPVRAIHTMGATDSRKIVDSLLSATAAGRITLPVRVTTDRRRRLETSLEQLPGQTRKLRATLGKQGRDPPHRLRDPLGRHFLVPTAEPRPPSPFPTELNQQRGKVIQFRLGQRPLPQLSQAAPRDARNAPSEVFLHFIAKGKGQNVQARNWSSACSNAASAKLSWSQKTPSTTVLAANSSHCRCRRTTGSGRLMVFRRHEAPCLFLLDRTALRGPR